jgi:hypothetical protein
MRTVPGKLYCRLGMPQSFLPQVLFSAVDCFSVFRFSFLQTTHDVAPLPTLLPYEVFEDYFTMEGASRQILRRSGG